MTTTSERIKTLLSRYDSYVDAAKKDEKTDNYKSMALLTLGSIEYCVETLIEETKTGKVYEQ